MTTPISSTIAQQLQTEGIQHFQNQKYNQALEKFNKAIELDSKNAQYFCDRGSTFYNLQKYQEALSDYDTAIKLDPTDPEFFYHKAFILYAIYHNTEESLQNINKGLALNSQHTALLELQQSINQ